jgi:Dolichyl-phosphate-mannose-protein mannosyltransferase
MTEPSLKSIADPEGRPVRSRLPIAMAMLAIGWGVMAAIVYWQQGLTLSHYDAKAHLVVARRVIDSLTPGWLQLGAVWLPLPHVLNLLPVQVDAWYRTGASGVAVSILSLGLLVYCSARLVLRLTGSRAGALTTSLILVSNPNLLYLQSTPMTEPLLLGLISLALVLVVEAIDTNTKAALVRASVALAAACLTRYEAWPVAVAALVALLVVRWREGHRLTRALRAVTWLASVPLVGLLWFLVHSKVTVGAWFVTGGFYVPDPMYQHQVVTVSGAVWWGLRQLGSETLAPAAALAVALLIYWWWRRCLPAPGLIAFAWLGVAALPWYAFFQGHPLRIRYMVPLVVASAVVVGLGVGRLPRLRAVASALLLSGIWMGARPFDPNAAMVLEAQWDRPKSLARRAVTACLPSPGGDETIMASMGSLAHYMQELSQSGFALRDFVHEGNGDLWLAALERPRDYVRWILIEEVAEGGDMLAERARRDPAFVAGFTRICEGGGVGLYRLVH